MSEAVLVSRAQVLAHRVRTHGLDRAHRSIDELTILDLGVQDTGSGGAPLALLARLPGTVTPTIPDSWSRVWSVRGAPHWHRTTDLRTTARALWPADDADAGARLAGTGTRFRKAGIDPLEGLRTAAEALRRVVSTPMPKGEVSAAVTAALPDAYSYACRACQATHIQDNLLRLAALPAGLRLQPDTSPPVLARVPRWPGVPDRQEGAGAVVEAYLRVHGPSTPAAVANYVQTTKQAVQAAWPDGLVDVRVDGTACWLLEDQVDDLVHAPAPRLVRLLPSCDPWLLARDRDLVAPGKAHQKALWPVLGWPGAVLVDGEVAGTWRPKATSKRLDLTVTPFGELPKVTRAAIEAEAEQVAALRRLPEVRVGYTS